MVTFETILKMCLCLTIFVVFPIAVWFYLSERYFFSYPLFFTSATEVCFTKVEIFQVGYVIVTH